MRVWGMILAGMTLALPAMAGDIQAPSPLAMKVEFKDARVAATPAGGSVAVSMYVVNPNDTALVLVGAATPVAGQTILQRYVQTRDGMVELTPVNRLPLPRMSETVLAPGAMELQLVGLTTALEAGLEMPLTVKFEDGTERVIRLKVEGN